MNHSENTPPHSSSVSEHRRDEVGKLAQEYPNERRSLYIEFNDLFTFDRDLAEDYVAKPDRMQEYAEEALRIYDLPADVSLGQAHVRLRGLPRERERGVGEIRSKDIGECVSISGTVESTSRIESRVTEAAFECQRCGTMSYFPQSATELEEPHECQGCERQGPFDLNTDQSEFIDFQQVRIQERTPSGGDDLNVASIVVHLTDDLVDQLKPGEMVTVNGVIRRIDDAAQYNDATVHDKFIETISTELTESFPFLSISDEDIAQIVELSNDSALIEKISGSIAPKVYGYELEKQALAMQLFSGITKHLPDESRIRGDIHLLLIGDPGVAKTTLLRAAAALAPRSVHVNGSQSTKVGITAAATPSSGDSDPWELRAGAIVLADRGIACIDHFDALSDEAQSTLEEPMEQQVLNMSKASVTETLPARASILAAANPKYGRFDPYEPIGEQIDLEPGLISRFDLIFTMTDQADAKHDRDVAEHILQASYAGELNTRWEEEPNASITREEVEEAAEDVTPEINAELLQKYIAYAKRNVFPTMSDAAKEVIEEFYIDIRSKGSDEDAPAPVTVRKLEALVRLAEASARMRLSDTIEEEDAERVVKIVRSCLESIGVDSETGEFDADVVEVETVEDEREATKMISSFISDLEEEYDKGAPVDEVIDRGKREGLSAEVTEQVIESIRKKGELYEPAQGHLRTT